ncbi:phage tail protein [Clostridium sp. K25]|uniref:phage tail protein n=1 Tax=Clostridium sp. K25 TaxID=1443109 RepID=UPI0004D97521|nr:phage tail protein [Clostridium sp. K25]KEI06172.1 putative phage tail fiber protein [Clostridium sp. K25]
MKEQFYTILTAIGKAKIANASAMGTKLNITKLQVGDGGGSYYNPTEEQEQLKNKVWEGNIGSITVDKDNKNWIVIETLLPGDIGGFMIREAGIFDSDGNLIAVGKYPETYKPITSQGSLKDLKIRMILEISNTSTVTLKIDPTVILATQKDIQILQNNITQNKEETDKKIQKLTSQYEDCVKKIGNIKDLKTNNKDNLVSALNEVFTSADNGKKSIYNSIVGKKVTPKSKDFKDLTDAITDIKLGQGNAQASDVLSGKTFTNDTGVVQEGNIPVMGSKEIEPKTYKQELGKGYYDNIKIKGINDLDKSSCENIVSSIGARFSNIIGKKFAEGKYTVDRHTSIYESRFIIDISVNGLDFTPNTFIINIIGKMNIKEGNSYRGYIGFSETGTYMDASNRRIVLSGSPNDFIYRINVNRTYGGFNIKIPDVLSTKYDVCWMAFE